MDTRRKFEGLTNAEIEHLVRRACFRWHWQWFSAIVARWRWQLTLNRLRRLDDRQLADIGLRRDQLHTGHLRSET
jgi:uncharacterized protein YjiS (DUF1127 family)